MTCSLLAPGLGACGPANDTVSSGARPALELFEDMRIDGYAADLAPIIWIAVAADGTLAVSQQQDFSVHLFDPDGASLGTVGGGGEGPGEFVFVRDGGWFGDTLWVEDSRLARLTTFVATGELLETTPIPQPYPTARDAGRYPNQIRVNDVVAVLPWGRRLIRVDPRPDDPLINQFRDALFYTATDGRFERFLLTLPRPEGRVSHDPARH